MRSTLGILGGVSTELRTAAHESAAATTEQSAAVAQTSATIEELAATAIADNTHAVSAAAAHDPRHAGEGRDDRQRSLLAGEAQKIGEKKSSIYRHRRADEPARNAAIKAARAATRQRLRGRSTGPCASSSKSLDAGGPSRSARSSAASRQEQRDRSAPPSRDAGRHARSSELINLTVRCSKSIFATPQQKSAADPVSTAIVRSAKRPTSSPPGGAVPLATAESIDDLVETGSSTPARRRRRPGAPLRCAAATGAVLRIAVGTSDRGRAQLDKLEALAGDGAHPLHPRRPEHWRRSPTTLSISRPCSWITGDEASAVPPRHRARHLRAASRSPDHRRRRARRHRDETTSNCSPAPVDNYGLIGVINVSSSSPSTRRSRRMIDAEYDADAGSSTTTATSDERLDSWSTPCWRSERCRERRRDQLELFRDARRSRWRRGGRARPVRDPRTW